MRARLRPARDVVRWCQKIVTAAEAGPSTAGRPSAWTLAARRATFVNGENRNDRRDCTRNSNKSPNQFIINGLDIQKITDALLAPIYSPSLRDPRRTRLFSTPQLKTNQRIAFAKSSD
ncbi:hypothetical protein [Burkholderia territorii]|uniref:Uncharacterized protein n=1 Tax=Burkholderia territorii TaxID=1503055 RepID=A0A6L3NBP5_9BURK|nr:hypothetical protein [Burkholderia territorii]KAB0659408.1 hypothetical protein F7R13_23440 [Burkholderia territorii]MBM2775297.1 hypothetical protein [Burkholderia territorii]